MQTPGGSSQLDFKKRTALGRTGLEVSRLGISASYGIGADGVERAYRECGVNYMYWGSMRTAPFAEGFRRVAARHRSDLVLVVQSYNRIAWLMERSVTSALARLRTDYADVLLLGWYNQVPPQRILDAAAELKRKQKVRFVAVSCHRRPAFAGFLQNGFADILMFRYNAAHRGAEREVLPLFEAADRPGSVAYTATRWGELLDSRKMPPDTQAPRASDCYRFVLTDRRVDVCLTGPKNDSELSEALATFERGPMEPAELDWMRTVGDHLHRNTAPLRKRLMQLND